MQPLPPIDPAEVYKQQYAHFGRLNETLYKMPTVFAAIIGGLWYFAAGYLEKDRLVAGVVFAFSAAVSATCAVAVHRFRLALNGYLDNINALDGPLRVTLRDEHSWLPSTVRAMMWLMCLAVVLSLTGALYAAAGPRPKPVSRVEAVLRPDRGAGAHFTGRHMLPAVASRSLAPGCFQSPMT
ncbi:hypothetical protein GCM10009416_13330 [Craurococcus roseus]|uniref:Uncharacterized protein n=1 Tax=Craurococcus roseus TaxID=77585 RepID=A0ABP3PUF4_9PROT